MTMSPQLRLGLCQMPTEIRRWIYSYIVAGEMHLFLQDGKLSLCDCVTRNPSSQDDGYERRATGVPSLEVVWARRLASSWGPHWNCEARKGGGIGHLSGLLYASRRLYRDVVQYLAEAVVFHVADLNTLNCISLTSRQVDGSWDSLGACIANGLQELFVTLRLPLETCQALERDAGPNNSSEEATLWRRAWPAVTSLARLRKLDIELDHTDPSSWSVVSERAIMAPIISLGEALPRLTLVAHLPHLHPLYENDERHFTSQGHGDAPIPICRRVRQKYHCVEDADDGSCRVVRSRHDTFPVSVELYVLENNLVDFPQGETLQQIEARERARWKEGIDVQQEVEEVFSWLEDMTSGQEHPGIM